LSTSIPPEIRATAATADDASISGDEEFPAKAYPATPISSDVNPISLVILFLL
jgi:hypothetical protein